MEIAPVIPEKRPLPLLPVEPIDGTISVLQRVKDVLLSCASDISADGTPDPCGWAHHYRKMETDNDLCAYAERMRCLGCAHRHFTEADKPGGMDPLRICVMDLESIGAISRKCASDCSEALRRIDEEIQCGDVEAHAEGEAWRSWIREKNEHARTSWRPLEEMMEKKFRKKHGVLLAQKNRIRLFLCNVTDMLLKRLPISRRKY